MVGYNQCDIEALRNSGRFDQAWYLEEYPDVKALGMDPVEHYVWIGARLGRHMAAGLHNSPKVLGSDLQTQGRADASYEIETIPCGSSQGEPPIAVIVPIYDAPQETERCLRSLLRHTPNTVRIILIDDASLDSRIGELLERYSAHRNISIYRNVENLGFTRTINLGIIAAGRADVVILNSDTEVTPFWLRNLRRAAYSGPRVATATPFSDNAGTFSVPVRDIANQLPVGFDLDACARLVTRGSQRHYPIVPTGNGFCMYMRRDAVDEVGMLDAEAFPRGYGEENDFCMRAVRAGWDHVIDDATLIHHARAASFGSERTELLMAGRAQVDRRYPEYKAAVRAFYADPVVAKAREAVVASLSDLPVEKVRPRILYVISTLTGGTPRTNEDLMRAISDSVETLVLHCDSRTITISQFRNGLYKKLETRTLARPVRAFPHRSDDYDIVVRDWLLRYNIEFVHIRHIGWHSLGLIDQARCLEIPIGFSFHDFYTICPNVKLLDEKLVHCAGHCTAGKGSCRMELWNAAHYPSLKHKAVYEWRNQMQSVLQKCSIFFTTSESTKILITEAFPFLEGRNFRVIPHGRDFPLFTPPPPPPLVAGEKLRLLVAGHITPAKGSHIVAGLAAHAKQINLEIHVLGNFISESKKTSDIIVHGSYEREEFLDKVRAIRPHIAGVFSIWPETWCHTLTELWAAGLPVIGSSLGAVGERLRETGAGWICEEMKVEEVISIIDKIKKGNADISQRMPRSMNFTSVEEMKNRYLYYYNIN
jgi:GT2 family glycosyltransferase/glycosyltransferase involved in cell wall biosynthesis